MNFSFYFWCYCCCFLNNSAICWRPVLPVIVVPSYIFCLFNKVFLSSSSSNWDIIIVLLVILDFRCFSFLGKMCVGFKGLLFLMNLSLRLSLLLLSSWSYFACFFLSYDFAPSNANHFWNRTSRTMVEWHTSFFGSLFIIPSIKFFFTLLPSDQFFDQLRIHDGNPIN